MAERISGEDTIFTVVRDGDILEELPVQNFEINLLIEVESTEYAGETDVRKRETQSGYSFSATGHAEGSGAKGVIAFFEAIDNRARHKTVGMKVNVNSTLIFPNGDQKGITLNDVRLKNPGYRGDGKGLLSFNLSGESGTASYT